MQYVIYFLITTPLVLGGMLWVSAVTPASPPMFNTGYNALTTKAVDPAQAIAKAAAGKATADKTAAKAVADNTRKSANPTVDKKG